MVWGSEAASRSRDVQGDVWSERESNDSACGTPFLAVKMDEWCVQWIEQKEKAGQNRKEKPLGWTLCFSFRYDAVRWPSLVAAGMRKEGAAPGSPTKALGLLGNDSWRERRGGALQTAASSESCTSKSGPIDSNARLSQVWGLGARERWLGNKTDRRERAAL